MNVLEVMAAYWCHPIWLSSFNYCFLLNVKEHVPTGDWLGFTKHARENKKRSGYLCPYFEFYYCYRFALLGFSGEACCCRARDLLSALLPRLLAPRGPVFPKASCWFRPFAPWALLSHTQNPCSWRRLAHSVPSLLEPSCSLRTLASWALFLTQNPHFLRHLAHCDALLPQTYPSQTSCSVRSLESHMPVARPILGLYNFLFLGPLPYLDPLRSLTVTPLYHTSCSHRPADPLPP